MVYTCTRINTYTCACGCACTRAHRVTLTDKHTHGRVCMHVYIYNLTIHITMYTFFWEGGFQGLGKGERSSGKTKGEWVKRNYMCMCVCVHILCMYMSMWRAKERGEERWISRNSHRRISSGSSRDYGWAGSNLSKMVLRFGALLPFPSSSSSFFSFFFLFFYYSSFIRTGEKPKCCDYSVWEELAQQTLVSVSFLIPRRAVACPAYC